MTWRRYAYCVLLTVGLLGPVGRSAHAQETAAEEPEDPVERARLHFKLGVDFYRELNYRAALIEFERAYKASPHYKLLYNLGQVSIDLQEDWKAIEYFTRYLREGGSELAEARRTEVEQSIARLEKRLARVTVKVNLPGAEIFVDDSRVGHSPLQEAVKISVGRRRFVAVKPGYPDAERVVDVASGDDLEIELEFKERPVVAQVQTIKVTEAASGGVSAAAWTGIATGVVAAGAITMSVLTAVAQNSYDSERKVLTSERELERLRDDAKTKALISDIAWGATIVGAGLTTVLLFTSGEDEREDKATLDIGAGSVSYTAKF